MNQGSTDKDSPVTQTEGRHTPVIDNRLTFWLGVFILAAGFILSAIKAVMAPIAHDEAYSYLDFVSRPWNEVFTHYTAANHVLNTVLVKASTLLFGISELPLRIPALGGRILFLVGVFFVCRWVLPHSKWLRIGCLLSLAIQPFLMEFGACGRGYPLGIGFFFAGLAACLFAFEPGTATARAGLFRRLARYSAASICFGLAVASNLTLINPLLATALVFVLLELYKHDTAASHRRLSNIPGRFGTATAALLSFLIPAAIIIFAFYWGFRSELGLGKFKSAGIDDWWGSVKSIWSAAVCFSGPKYLYFKPDFFAPIYQWLTGDKGTAFAAIILLLVINNGLVSRYRHALVPVVAIIALCIVAIVLQHILFEVKFPIDRTGMYFIPLCIIGGWGALGCMDASLRSNNYPILRWGLNGGTAIFLVVNIVLSLATMSFIYYYVWPNNPPARDVMRRVQQIIKDQDRPFEENSIKLVTSWILDMNINYYRELYEMNEVARAERFFPASPMPQDANFYLIVQGDRHQLPRRIMKPIAEYPRYEATLYEAVPLPNNN